MNNGEIKNNIYNTVPKKSLQLSCCNSLLKRSGKALIEKDHLVTFEIISFFILRSNNRCVQSFSNFNGWHHRTLVFYACVKSCKAFAGAFVRGYHRATLLDKFSGTLNIPLDKKSCQVQWGINLILNVRILLGCSLVGFTVQLRYWWRKQDCW